MSVRILIGSKKGAFILESDGVRRDWRVRGPYCEHWPMTHVAAEAATGTIYGTGGNAWFGPAVWKSMDGGATWTHSSRGLAYPEGETPVQCAWVTHAAHGRLYIGVEPAGLFVSDDGGESFREVEGLRRHPSRPEWQAGGIGLVLHTIVSDPADPRRLWVGISSVGVFYTDDGGETWSPRNSGVRCDYLPEGQRYPEYGQCVHNMTLAPGHSNRLYQQNHCGIYRIDRPSNTWRRIGRAMSQAVGDIGFPMVVHPRDADKAWVIPMDGTQVWPRTSPDGKPAVYGTRDGGESWQRLDNGMPPDNAWWTVKRQAMCADSHNPAGLYFGTTSGALWASMDEGGSWFALAEDLPHIYAVESAVVE